MLDHADPAVVSALRVRGLARGISRFLVDLGEFDLLELVGLVVDDRPDERRGRERVQRHRLLGVAHQLEVRLGRIWRARRVGDVEGGVDDVAAAMERERLHDLVAIRGGRLELELDLVGASRQLARTGEHPIGRPMVRHAVADQAGLRDEGALGALLEREIGLGGVVRVAMLVECHQRDHAADRVDFGGVEVGLDRHDLAGGRGCGRRVAGHGGLRGRAGRRARRGRWQVGGFRVALRCDCGYGRRGRVFALPRLP